MRRFLTTLGILSTLVLAQSVLAATSLSPWPEPVLEPFASSLGAPSPEASIASFSDEAGGASSASLVLLFAGISGLVVAGNRRADGELDVEA